MSQQAGFEVRIELSHDDAITKVIGVLKEEGFGVLTRVDIDKAFKEKIGEEFRPYTILGACNPGLAHAALSSKPEIGLMLPCNVTVEAMDQGSLVRIINPKVMMEMGDMGTDDAVRTVATDAAEKLERVASALGG